jgi:hypothetical protein
VKIEILDDARQDLLDGSQFYNRVEASLGDYFFNSLLSDIDSLQIYAGIPSRVFDYYRCLSKRFPFAIYYEFHPGLGSDLLSARLSQEPTWIRQRLQRQG